MIIKHGLRLTFGFFVLYILGSWWSSAWVIERRSLTDASLQYLYMAVTTVLLFLVLALLMSVHVALRDYAESIKGSNEQPAFLGLSKGAMLLYISLLISAFIGIARTLLTDSDLYPILTVAQYYLAGLFAVAFFYHFGRAGSALVDFVKRQKMYRMAQIVIGLVILTISAYSWVRITASNQINENHILVYLPETIVLISLFLPLVLAWIYGLAGAYGIFLYQKYSQGVVYKESMIWFTAGTLILVAVSLMRHIGDYLTGAPHPGTALEDFSRVAILLTIVIVSMYFMRRGVELLHKIEKAR